MTGAATATVGVRHIVEAAGISVIPHGGMNDAYGQHVLCHAEDSIGGEFFLGAAPGVPRPKAIGAPPECRCQMKGT